MKTVYYHDFGAVGDGKCDDFDAVRSAHEYANENGFSVSADDGASYYIGNHKDLSISIKTDTDWTGASFIIDDTVVRYNDPARRTPVFKIESDAPAVRHEADSETVKAIVGGGGIKTDTKKICYAPGYPVMLIPYDTTHKVYIRYGGNANDGQDQHEVILIDGEGNIDKDTPALLDYGNISYIIEKRIDDEPITLSGGTVVTVANRSRCNYDYYMRNIAVTRSNVTVRGLTHKIVGEGDTGAPYAGFLDITMLNNFRAEDCTFQAHRLYWEERERDADGNVTVWGSCMGTYEIGGGNINGLYLIRCDQSNFFDKDGKPSLTYYDENGNTALNNRGETAALWGLMGTNYSKNIVYDSCVLNRLDAHAGVYNASLINSKTVMVYLIGGGTALIKDSTVYCDFMMYLRDDFGSTWNGEMIIENCEWYTEDEEPVLLLGGYYNHDFGYKTYLPTVKIDGLRVHGGGDSVYVYSDYHLTEGQNPFADKILIDGELTENKNPMTPPKYITVTENPMTNKKIKISKEGSGLGKFLKTEIR